MFNLPIQPFCPFDLSKIRLFLFFLFVWTPAVSQIYSGEKIYVHFDSINPRQAEVQQIFYLQSNVHSGDTLLFYNYLKSYENIHSALGKSIAGHYKLEFHFSGKKERGSIRIKSNSAYDFIEEGDILKIIPKKEFNQILLHYTIRLPDSKFTGLGYAQNHYHLFEFFLQPVVYDGKNPLLYPNKNLDDRPVMQIPVRIKMTGFPPSLYWQSNARLIHRNDSLIWEHPNNHIEIVSSDKPFEKFQFEHTTIVLEKGIYENNLRTIRLLDEILQFLSEENIPLPEKILITRRDLRQNPVYGPDWLPLLNGFPEDFKIQTSLLKQILYKAGRELLWDQRKMHALMTGLWQYYIKKFIEKYYPDIRLTGKQIKFPLLRGYHFFQVPYTSKYRLSYLYMARMNRDQALRLPADSLTLFNRNVTAPYKAALGWEFVAKYASNDNFNNLIRDWFHLLQKDYGNIRDLKTLFRKNGLEQMQFLFKDYYQTARKIDWKIKKHNKNALEVVNVTGVSSPVLLDMDSIDRNNTGFIVPCGSVIIEPEKKFRFFIVNATNPLPDIHPKNNFYPWYKRPLKIRFIQDLENSYALQLFVNPDFDYNYYDGFILGLGLSNKSLPDKPFTWEMTPEYGTKSRYWGGNLSFKYKKHFVRPLLHGISLGGYYKSFHYAPAKTYLTYSIFATLSHKNRRAGFFKENDLSLEWLYVDKETGVPADSTRYGVLLLNNHYQSRGLLKQTRWTSSLQFHRKFIKLQTDFRFRAFMDKYRQIEWRIFAGWMPFNKTAGNYFSFALSRPTDYLFKYKYYGRSETSGIFYQQYIYAEGAFKVFFPRQFADQWMLTNNLYLGIWKRFNLFIDFGWLKNRTQSTVFHYDAGLRYYLVPDYFEIYFPLLYDNRPIPLNNRYFSRIRIMFVIDLPNLLKMFTRSWY